MSFTITLQLIWLDLETNIDSFVICLKRQKCIHILESSLLASTWLLVNRFYQENEQINIVRWLRVMVCLWCMHTYTQTPWFLRSGGPKKDSLILLQRGGLWGCKLKKPRRQEGFAQTKQLETTPIIISLFQWVTVPVNQESRLA